MMVWECFEGRKSGDLVEVKGILQKKQYHSILQRHTILSGTRIIGKTLILQEFILQQDNDPKYTSKYCQNRQAGCS